MKNFNYAYKNLKDQANELKTTHFKQSGYIELKEQIQTVLQAWLKHYISDILLIGKTLRKI